MDQQQQQRTVADETKPQAAVKGGESPHVAQTKFVQRSPGEWQPISSPNPAVGDRWRLAYEGGFV